MPTGTGSISITTLNTPSTENFDTLSNTAASTTNIALPTGWYITETGGGARDNEQYAVDNGTSTTGDTYSYGASASTERALGELRSGTLIPVFGSSFTNNTGSTITSLDIAFAGEEWRLGTAGRTDTLNFEYSLNATDVVTGTWTPVAGLAFNTPDTVTTGAKNGNAAADRTALSTTITGLSIPNGATFWIHWTDTDATGADDGLAIDDFSLTAHASGAAPTLSIADVSHNEGNAGTTTFTFTVSLSAAAPAGGVSFDIATADGTATTAGGDYVAKALTSQTIPQGSSTYTFDVLVNGDTILESDESFFVNVTNVTGATIVDGQGLGTIVNDEVPPTPGAFAINDVSVAEGDSGTTPITFTVSRDPTSNVAASVHYVVTLPGGAGGADASDFAPAQALSGDLAFGANETSKTIILQVAGDVANEPNETFTITLSAPTNGATLADATGIGTIANDDAPPAASVNDVAIAEGQNGISYANFTINLDKPATTAVTIDYATSGGTATAGSDYLGVSGTLTFAVGETSKTVSVPIVGDTIAELNETFTVNLSNASGATIGDAQGVATITNDDSPAYFALNSANFSENWTDTSRITADDDWSHVASIVGYLGDIDPAGAATAVDPRTLTGANLGAVDVIANMPAPTSSGGVGEFQFGNPTIALQGSGTADAPSIVLYMDARGRTDVHLTATLRDMDSNSDNAAQPIDVQYRTDPNGAWTNVPGGYFADVTTVNSATQTTSLDVTLPADANNAATLQIRILTTNAIGSDEWVGIDDINVSSNQGPPSYSIADAAAFEGNSATTPITFTVTRAGDTSAAGNVGYSVDLGSDGFSASASDFASPLSGTVSFNAGEAAKTITLNVNGDTLPEADEGFTVTLHNPSSGNLGDASATGTIVNDDGPPPFVTISDVTQAEGDSGTTAFTFTVTRTGGTTGFTVDYATLGGTATSPSDFTAANGTLTFAPNENSKTITILVNGDTAGEHAETFSVKLSNALGAVVADPTGIGTILNDDVVPIYQLQGAGHISPFVGENVKTDGIVTAVDSNGFYLQDAHGDGNSATSDAIFVFTGAAPTVLVGDSIRVTGVLTEFAADATNLTLTEINSPVITVLTHDNPLPLAIPIGVGGILPPTTFLDNDALTSYDPAQDGLDFYESLEGMRVTILSPGVVSNTNSFGETYVVASDGVGATGMNGRGGITISGDHVGTPIDYNPERIQIDDDSGIFAGFTPNYTIGDRLSDVSGILSYSHSSYEVLVTAPVTVTQDVTLPQETTALDGDADHLTIADYNIENADPGDPQLKFDLLAHNIVYNLQTPDIVGLQEIQDADGPGSGSDFSGYATAQKLIDAIVAAGGPVYSYVEVTPTGSTGGEPNGHIHPGYLYDASRVSYVPGSASIIVDAAYAGSRNPLVAQFVFNSQTITLIDVHFTSRLGSDALEGGVQPPQDAGDASRTAQGQAVANYVAGLLAVDPSLKLGVLGDFNGFYFEGGVGAIEATGLTDLLRTLPSQERYTYMFDGNAQAIDHIIVSPSLFNGAQFDAVHLNSEYDFNGNRPTDHDSVIARFSIGHPDPVILPATDAMGQVAELADHAAGENVATLSDSGAIFFSNPDSALSHSAAFVPQGGSYLGTFTLGAVDQGSDSVAWSFSVPDSVLDPLRGGETLKQYYTVTIDDGHGGSVNQVVEVDLVGSNDAAILSSASVAVEQGSVPATASGALTISDADAGEAVFQAQNATQGLYGDFSIDAAGHWSYTADQVYALAPNQSRTDVFTIVAADGTPTNVAVTIIGHDQPGGAQSDLFTTDEATILGAGRNLFADNGSGADSDPDSPLQIAAVNGVAGNVGHVVQLASGAQLVVNADGTFRYDPNHAFDYLTGAVGAANQFGSDSFSYTLAGGSSATVFVNIQGVTSPGDEIFGNTLDNRIFGTGGPDSFRLEQGGHDIASGMGGNDGFYFGAALDSGDKVDGGAGTDTLAVQGNTNVVLGDIANVEVLLALSGSDTRFGDTAGNSYSYDITTNDGNVAPGAILTVIGTGLLPGENLTFDGSAETDGAFRIFAGQGVDDLVGGHGSDGFLFGADGNLTAADHVDGGTGIDTLALRGNYVGGNAVVFQDGSIANIEVLALLSGHSNEYGGVIVPAGFDYDLTMADGNVAAGQRLDVNAAALGADESVRFDGHLESNGSFRILSGAGDDTLIGSAQGDLIYGGLGADRLTGGAGADTYLYHSAAESTSTGYDIITGFDYREDRIDVPGGGSRSFSQAGTGALSTASFDADLSSGLSGVLGAGQAALFTANGGTLSGHVFAVIDANGVAGYQAGQDLVIEMVAPVVPIDMHAGVIV
ncbi:MAG: hypothetical protein JWP15_1731 [Alphaproteobacteria bacterium]|nr:hypothetical protein [Alphaproteobacteria bacterium]